MGAGCLSARGSFEATYLSPTKQNAAKARKTPLTIDITPSPVKTIDFTA